MLGVAEPALELFGHQFADAPDLQSTQFIGPKTGVRPQHGSCTE
jgi:hypothetical protein